VPEVDVTDTAWIRFLSKSSGKLAMISSIMSTQFSHHSSGDCSSRNFSSKMNFLAPEDNTSPFSSTNTALAPCVPTSIPKKYVLICNKGFEVYFACRRQASLKFKVSFV